MTDFIKESLFGVDKTDSWIAAVGNRPLVLLAMVVAVAALVFVVYWIATRKAPPGDHGIRLKADPLPPECQGTALYRTARASQGIFDRALLEKVVLTGLISVVFAEYLLSDAVRSTWVLTFVALFVVVNAFASQWLARRGRAWHSVLTELAVMFVVNYGIVGVLLYFELVLGRIAQRGSVGARLFFVFLFTVITVLFDRYHTVFTARGVLARRGKKTPAGPAGGVGEQPQAT